MNFFTSFFGGVKSFFNKLFVGGGEDFLKLIEKISPIVNMAYPLVKRVAALTPNKTDDEILKAYHEFGVANLFEMGSNKSVALRDLVKHVLQKLNGGGVSEYIANTAIELAYAKYKEEQKSNQ